MVSVSSLHTPLWGRDEVLKVMEKTKFCSDLSKYQVFDLVNFPMAMREGEKSKNKHQNKKYHITSKTQKNRRKQGNIKGSSPQYGHHFFVVVKFPLDQDPS